MIGESKKEVCALCLKSELLVDSHLTPKWVYRRLQETGIVNSDPISVTKGSAFITSKQVKKHLLCMKCEQKFSKYEDYAAQLTDDLRKKPLEYFITKNITFPGSVELNCDKLDSTKLSYFVISVIWRSCFIDGGCKLGKYKEDFRRYLLDESGFPKFAALIMTIIKPSGNGNCYKLYTQPSSGRDGQLWFHGFSLFGLTFRCHVGKALDPKWKTDICLASDNKRKYALLTSQNECSDFHGVVKAIRNAQPRGKLKKQHVEKMANSHRTALY